MINSFAELEAIWEASNHRTGGNRRVPKQHKNYHEEPKANIDFSVTGIDENVLSELPKTSEE